MKDNKTEEIRLVLLNGKSITITYPEELGETILDEIIRAWQGHQIYWCDNYTSVEVDYYDNLLGYIDMSQVVGMAY